MQLIADDLNAPATVPPDGKIVTGPVTRMSPGTVLFVGPWNRTAGGLPKPRIEGLSQEIRARFVQATDGGAQLQSPLGHEHLAYAAETLARITLRHAA
jgi:hypothetical protein